MPKVVCLGFCCCSSALYLANLRETAGIRAVFHRHIVVIFLRFGFPGEQDPFSLRFPFKGKQGNGKHRLHEVELPAGRKGRPGPYLAGIGAGNISLPLNRVINGRVGVLINPLPESGLPGGRPIIGYYAINTVCDEVRGDPGHLIDQSDGAGEEEVRVGHPNSAVSLSFIVDNPCKRDDALQVGLNVVDGQHIIFQVDACQSGNFDAFIYLCVFIGEVQLIDVDEVAAQKGATRFRVHHHLGAGGPNPCLKGENLKEIRLIIIEAGDGSLRIDAPVHQGFIISEICTAMCSRAKNRVRYIDVCIRAGGHGSDGLAARHHHHLVITKRSLPGQAYLLVGGAVHQFVDPSGFAAQSSRAGYR